MLTARAGVKRPHGVAAGDMRHATSNAFSDEAFLDVLTAALDERERRLVETERRQTARFHYAPPERAQTPPLGSTSRPAPTTPERLPSKALKDLPSGVLPHEEASFRAFVEKAQAWMKTKGIEGELTPEAAMKAFTTNQAAITAKGAEGSSIVHTGEAARQRVAAEGGRVEDHPHLRRFWSADHRAKEASSESAAGGGAQASGPASCELTAGAPSQASAMPAFDLSPAPAPQPSELTAGGP